jgi:fibronectin-binding autotransporter adhesin
MIALYAPDLRTITWNVDAGGNWFTASNWTPQNVPGGAGRNATIGGSFSGTRTITINDHVTLFSLILSQTTSSLNIAASAGKNLYFQSITGADCTIVITNLITKTLACPIVLLSNLTISGPSLFVTISGVISGTANLTIASSTVTLSGANTFIGTVTINGGTITYNATSRLGDLSNAIVLGGGILTMNANFTEARNISVNANSNYSSSSSATLSGNISGAFTFKCTSNGSGTTTYSGTISLSGQWQLTSGTHKLTGTHSGTGSIINSVNIPVFIVTGSITNSTGTLSGLILKGNGSIAKAVTIQANGSIEASDGVSTPGTLTLTTNFTMTSAGTAPDLIVRTSGTSVGIIAVTGNATLKCNIQFPDSSLTAGTYDILTYTGTLTDNGIALGATNNTGRTLTLVVDTINKKIQIIAV